jgi:flagellar biosynthesis/type III secretory pathway protein FliH
MYYNYHDFIKSITEESHGYGYDDSSSYYGHYETRYQEGYEEGYDDGYSSGYSDYEDEEGEED